MAYKIEAHIVDQGTEEIFVTLTFWGETEEEANEVYLEALESWPLFAKADKDERIVLEEGPCDDDERPVIDGDQEEDEEEAAAAAQ